MIEIRVEIYSLSEKLPEIRKLVYAKYDVENGNWFPVRLMRYETPPHIYYWQDLTEPEAADQMPFNKYTHWLELPTEL